LLASYWFEIDTSSLQLTLDNEDDDKCTDHTHVLIRGHMRKNKLAGLGTPFKEEKKRRRKREKIESNSKSIRLAYIFHNKYKNMFYNKKISRL